MTDLLPHTSQTVRITNCTFKVDQVFSSLTNADIIQMVKWIPMPLSDSVVLGSNACYAHRQSILHRGICPPSHFPSSAFVLHVRGRKVHIRLFSNNSAIVTGCITEAQVQDAIHMLSEQWKLMQGKRIQVELAEMEPKVAQDELVYSNCANIGYRYGKQKTKQIRLIRYMIHDTSTLLHPITYLLDQLQDTHSQDILQRAVENGNQYCFVQDLKQSISEPIFGKNMKIYDLHGYPVGITEIKWNSNINAMGIGITQIELVGKYVFVKGKVEGTLHSTIDTEFCKFQALPTMTYTLPYIEKGSTIIHPPSNMHCLMQLANFIDVKGLSLQRQNWAVAKTFQLTSRDELWFTYQIPRNILDNTEIKDDDDQKKGIIDCNLPKRNCPSCKHISVKVFEKGSIILTGVDRQEQIPHLHQFLIAFLSAP